LDNAYVIVSPADARHFGQCLRHRGVRQQRAGPPRPVHVCGGQSERAGDLRRRDDRQGRASERLKGFGVRQSRRSETVELLQGCTGFLNLRVSEEGSWNEQEKPRGGEQRVLRWFRGLGFFSCWREAMKVLLACA
jgi:hypothetical protein